MNLFNVNITIVTKIILLQQTVKWRKW